MGSIAQRDENDEPQWETVQKTDHTAADEAYWDAQHADDPLLDEEPITSDEVDPWTLGDQWEADGLFDDGGER